MLGLLRRFAFFFFSSFSFGHIILKTETLNVFHWQVYFDSEEVYACVVTCGGLCPGLNTVIREIVGGLHHMYGVHRVLGIEV